MKTRLFVLVGFCNSNSEKSIIHLQSRIQEALNNSGLSVTAQRKDLLISIRFEEISFYVSLVSDKSEMKDWFEMAKDFELKVNKKPVPPSELKLQYSKLSIKKEKGYNPIHFSIAWII
ncbi:MAG: hypothetical protein EOO01_01690, partial [Chitinophagaceae bacterium]